MGKACSIYNHSVGKPKRKKSLGRPGKNVRVILK
jgi:hypothetical protein